MWSLAWNMARVWELLVGFPQGQRCLSRGVWGCDSVLEYLPSTHETLASSHFPKGKQCSLATQYERPAVGAVSPKGQSCTGPLQRMQVCYFHPHCPSIIKWRGSIFILASWAFCPITVKRMPSFLFCSLFWKKYFSGAANYGMLRFRAIWCPRRIARYGREKQAKDSRTCLHSSTFPLFPLSNSSPHNFYFFTTTAVLPSPDLCSCQGLSFSSTCCSQTSCVLCTHIYAQDSPTLLFLFSVLSSNCLRASTPELLNT